MKSATAKIADTPKDHRHQFLSRSVKFLVRMVLWKKGPRAMRAMRAIALETVPFFQRLETPLFVGLWAMSGCCSTACCQASSGSSKKATVRQNTVNEGSEAPSIPFSEHVQILICSYLVKSEKHDQTAKPYKTSGLSRVVFQPHINRLMLRFQNVLHSAGKINFG